MQDLCKNDSQQTFLPWSLCIVLTIRSLQLLRVEVQACKTSFLGDLGGGGGGGGGGRGRGNAVTQVSVICGYAGAAKDQGHHGS